MISISGGREEGVRLALPTRQPKCLRAWSRRWLELCARNCVSNGVLLERQNIAIIIIIIIRGWPLLKISSFARPKATVGTCPTFGNVLSKS